MKRSLLFVLAWALASVAAAGIPPIPPSAPGMASKVTLTPTPTQTAGLVTNGDSLTYGYTPVLAALLSPQTVVNNGVPGQSVMQIGARVGAFPTTLTSTGGTICDSGGDAVTFPAGFEVVTNTTVQSSGVTGTLAGHHGTVTYNGSTWTFTCDVTSTSYSLLNATPFIVDQSYRNYATQFFWVGHNNGQIPQTTLWTVVNSIVDNIPPSQQFAFLSNTYDTGSTTYLPSGTFGETVSQNNNYAQGFGASHYIDIQTPLIAAYTSGFNVDSYDHTNGIPPTSTRLLDGVGTLTSSINSTTDSIAVTESGGTGAVQVGDLLVIDTLSSPEVVVVSAVSGTYPSFTVTTTNTSGTRLQWAGTSAASHSSGASVFVVNYIHFGAKSYGGGQNGCIASSSAWASAFPSAQTSCGYDIIASTLKTWLTNNPPPSPAAPSQTATTDGQTQISAGVVAGSSNANQAPLGTTQHPLQGSFSQINFPGTGFVGGNQATFNNLYANSISAGIPGVNNSAWWGCFVLTGNDFCNPLNGASVTLGNSASPYTAADLAHVSFFSYVLNPDTNDFGSVGTSSKAFGQGYFNDYIIAGAIFTTTGSACSVGSTAGGGSGGKFTSSTAGTCAVVINMANSVAAPHGWDCHFNDLTTPADTSSWAMTATTTTTASASGTTASGDVVSFTCVGY